MVIVLRLVITIFPLLLSCILIADETLCKQTEFITVEALANSLPLDLAASPIVHLKTLAVQRDTFSCGYHALFHALAIDIAIQNGYGWERELEKHLADKELFEKVCAATKAHTQTDKPLNGVEISAIAGSVSLGSKLIPLFYTDKQELMIPALYACVQHPINMPRDGIEQLLEQRRKEIVKERILELLQSVNNKPYQARHFICNVGNHWMLFSVVVDMYVHAKLYLIGSWNEPLTDTTKKMARDLLECMGQAGMRVW
jgi:hypothetical protein